MDPQWLVAVTLGAVVPALIRRFDVGACVDRALARAGINRASAAVAMETSEPQLSRAISGCGPEHLSADQLTRLDDHFWDCFQLEVAAVRGRFPDAATRAKQDVEDMTNRIHRQAKTSLPRENEGERKRA